MQITTEKQVAVQSNAALLNESQLKDVLGSLHEKLTKKETELMNKLYLIEGKKKTKDYLYEFITKEAKWKFTEGLGIIEIKNQLNGIKKDKEIMVSGTMIEAIYYFLSKHESVGDNSEELFTVECFVNNLVKPVSDALGRMKADKIELDQIARDIASAEQAIETGASAEDSIIKDILKENQ